MPRHSHQRAPRMLSRSPRPTGPTALCLGCDKEHLPACRFLAKSVPAVARMYCLECPLRGGSKPITWTPASRCPPSDSPIARVQLQRRPGRPGGASDARPCAREPACDVGNECFPVASLDPGGRCAPARASLRRRSVLYRVRHTSHPPARRRWPRRRHHSGHDRRTTVAGRGGARLTTWRRARRAGGRRSASRASIAYPAQDYVLRRRDGPSAYSRRRRGVQRCAFAGSIRPSWQA